MYKYLGDTGILMYDLLGSFSFYVLIFFNFTQFKKKQDFLGKSTLFLREKLLKRKTRRSLVVCSFIELLLISYVQNYFVGSINWSFGRLVGTGANYFGLLFIGPIILFVFFYLISVNPFKQMDLITPAYAIALVFVKLACFCGGCCKGMECSWGLYYPSNDAVMFPSQLVEAGLALIIFVILLKYRKKAKEGTLFPIYLILYSSTRFFAEFFRIEENVFWIFKTYHILCLIGVVVGVLQLWVVKKYSQKIIEIYEKAPFPWMKMGKISYQERKSKPKKTEHNKNGVQHKQKTKKSHSRLRMWVLIWSLGLMGQIGWNVEGVWFNTFVYEKIEKNPSIITPMLILSALATTVSIFLFGTLSDRTGRRRTLISTGYIVWGVLTIAFGMTQFIAKNFFSLAIICIVLCDMFVSFFGSMSTDVGFGTWTTDIMNDKNRGQIGGAIAVQCVLGSLLGNIIGGYIVGEENNYLRLFIVVGSVLSMFGVISAYMFTKKDDVKPSVHGTFKEQFLSVFDFKNIFKQKELVWVNISVIVFFTGFDTYFPHMGNYLIHYLGFSADKMGIIEAIPLVLAMIVTIPVSKYLNNNKFVDVSVLAIVCGLIGLFFILPITPESVDTTKVFNFRLYMGAFLIGISYVVMLQSTKVWSKKLYPKGSKGQYEGLWAISYALIPMIFASTISQNIVKTSGVTVVNELTGQLEYIPNANIFIAGVIISTVSIIPIIITKKFSNKKFSETENRLNTK